MSQNCDQPLFNEMDENLDMSDLEDRLYAKIHYEYSDQGLPLDTASAENVAAKTDTRRSVSSHSLVNNASGSGPAAGPTKYGRYWSGGGGSNDIGHGSKSRYNKKQSNASNAQSKQLTEINQAIETPVIPSGKRPKPFTPYTPLLSDTGIVVSNLNTADKTVKDSTALDKSSEKRHSSKSTKNKNQSHTESSTKCINPFSKLSENHRKRKEKYDAKKDRANKNRQAATASKRKENVVVQEIADNDDDDDDVVLIPSVPPPLICIDDSSEDEDVTKKSAPIDSHKFTEPGKKSASHASIRPGSSRCPSPTSSIVSDDFIANDDRRRLELDAFAGVADEELFMINQAVERSLRESVSNPSAQPIENLSSTSATSPSYAAEPVFAAPSKKPKQSNKKKSYVVSENSFAAVDVYESESSDMPDTVYAKGKRVRRNNSSSSDSAEINNVNSPTKSKRLHKRKSSGSNKGSDHRTDFSTSEDEDDDDIDISPSQEVRNTIPYLVRGEALGKVRKPDKRKKKSKQKLISASSEKHSDEDFITTLTSIVHADSENDNSNEDVDNIETSHETIDARDIVQSVLQRRKKKLRVTDGKDKSDSNGQWEVKDQVGVTDDVSLLNVDQPLICEDRNGNGECVVSDSVAVSEETNNDGNAIPIVANDNLPAETENVSIVDLSGNDSVHGNPLVVNPEIGWNEEMDSFYNRSWGGETFSTKGIQHGQPKTYLEWAIGSADKYLYPTDRSTHRSKYARVNRCMNCRESGHRVMNCPMPPLPLRCYMCGETGHMEPRCPNTVCLLCGRKTNSFVYGCDTCLRNQNIRCHLCKNQGHRAMDCPDKWRRYHTTTTANSTLTRHESPLPIKPKFCSVCCSKGHIAENCRNGLRMFSQPIPSVYIKNYEESYKRIFDDAAPEQLERFNTFYKLKDKPYTFDFENQVNDHENTFYGRFSRSVQLPTPLLDTRAQQIKNVKKRTRTIVIDDETPSTSNGCGKSSTTMISKQQEENPSVKRTKQDNSSHNDNTERAVNKREKKSNETKKKENDIDICSTVNNTENSETISNEISQSLVKNTEKTPTETLEEPSGRTKSERRRSNSFHIKAEADKSMQDDLTNNTSANNDKSNDRSDAGTINFSFTEEIAALETFSDQPIQKKFDLSFISETCQLDTEEQHNSGEDIRNGKRNRSDTRRKMAELERLNNEEIRLENMKRNLMSTASPKPQKARSMSNPRTIARGSKSPQNNLDAPNHEHEDSDSNYSFSEYYNESHSKRHRKNPDEYRVNLNCNEVEREEMPDFIPLNNSTNSETFLNESMPSPPPPPVIGEEVSCDAKIFLTKDHCKYLLTTQGNTFLRNVSTQNNVLVRMEWRSIGNVLIVSGAPSNQDKFHSELITFFSVIERKLKTRSEIGIPKNRHTLVRTIIEMISQLEKPMGNVMDLYDRMRRYEEYQTKASTKCAERFRKELNMILMGQVGLAHGRLHLTHLQQNLRDLMNSHDELVAANFRREINEHIAYIFSPVDHGNYADLIHQFKELRKSKNLPILNLDRKLLGLPINVRIDKFDEPKEMEEVEDPVPASKSEAENSTLSVKDTNITPAIKAPTETDKSVPINQPTPKKASAVEQPATKPEQKETLEAPSKPNDSDDDAFENINEKDVKNPMKASPFWSQKSVEFVAKWKNIPEIKSNANIMGRLDKVVSKGTKNHLSYNDFKVLQKIFNNIKNRSVPNIPFAKN